MPFKTDEIALNDKFLDRRAKLLDCQKEMAKYWHKQGSSIRAIARMFKVDKRTIQFLLYPERLIENKKRRQERGGTMAYYNKEKHKEQMKEHRRYKYNTLKSNSNENKLPKD